MGHHPRSGSSARDRRSNGAGLGIYFLLGGSTYVFFYFFHDLPPSAPRLHLEIPVMAEVWLPLGLGFAILNKSQNERPAANVPD